MKSDADVAVEDAWRVLLIANPWPQTDENEVRRLLLAAAPDRADWSSDLNNAHLDLLTAWQVEMYTEMAHRFDERLCRLNPAQRRRLVRLTLRCPENCTLVEIFTERIPTGGMRVFFYAKNQRRTKVFVANRHTDDWTDPHLWVPISWRHGSGRISRDTPVDLAISEVPHGASRPITGDVPVRGGKTPVLEHPRYNRWTPRRAL